jgi:recombinational DNA repair protein (RecF pathway)
MVVAKHNKTPNSDSPQVLHLFTLTLIVYSRNPRMSFISSRADSINNLAQWLLRSNCRLMAVSLNFPIVLNLD